MRINKIYNICAICLGTAMLMSSCTTKSAKTMETATEAVCTELDQDHPAINIETKQQTSVDHGVFRYDRSYYFGKMNSDKTRPSGIAARINSEGEVVLELYEDELKPTYIARIDIDDEQIDCRAGYAENRNFVYYLYGTLIFDDAGSGYTLYAQHNSTNSLASKDKPVLKYRFDPDENTDNDLLNISLVNFYDRTSTISRYDRGKGEFTGNTMTALTLNKKLIPESVKKVDGLGVIFSRESIVTIPSTNISYNVTYKTLQYQIRSNETFEIDLVNGTMAYYNENGETLFYDLDQGTIKYEKADVVIDLDINQLFDIEDGERNTYQQAFDEKKQG